MKPFSPNDVRENKPSQVPSKVIKAFNDLLVKKFDGNSAILYQDDIVNAIISNFNTSPSNLDYDNLRNTIFTKGWLNIEDIFRNVGWNVEYDKPDYNSTNGRAYWVFTELTRRKHD